MSHGKTCTFDQVPLVDIFHEKKTGTQGSVETLDKLELLYN
jgi:hypothetical protein